MPNYLSRAIAAARLNEFRDLGPVSKFDVTARKRLMGDRKIDIKDELALTQGLQTILFSYYNLTNILFGIIARRQGYKSSAAICC